MIYYILLYKFKPGVDRINEHLEVISRFRYNTDGLIELEYGKNIVNNSSDNFTHGFIMSFTNREALNKYNKSESHSNLVNAFKDDIEAKKNIDLEDHQLIIFRRKNG